MLHQIKSSALGILTVVAFTCVQNEGSDNSAPVDFLAEVRPILAQYCFKCHGPDEETRKSGLRLDIREEALKAAKSDAFAIVPGNLEKSELVRRIFTSDEDDVMPPPAAKMPLTEKQKQILKDWVAQGAGYKPHWSFSKPVPAPLPEVKDQAWVKNGIDQFVLARLDKEGLKPSPPADKYTLARRVYLDLIGLPPTPAQADAFVNDSSTNAYERLVDHLLDSPRYGERWARRWLDLARYADTNGYEKDRQRSMWPYRDWVIDALNADMPFDQFTIEQIAGDMLPNATMDQKIATGFHRNTMINEEGGIDPLEYRFYSMVDRVHVTATTWLGLTVACAQCHTHKYDPIQHNEYYQFMAFMNNADEPTVDVVKPEISTRRDELLARITHLESTLHDRFPAPTAVEWSVPAEVEFSAASGATGEALLDGSFRVTGTNPEKDIYTLKVKGNGSKITHVQVEAIPDEKVVKGGPGRTDHGNFVLSELEMEVEAGKKVKWSTAEADFVQPGFPPENAFDGKADTGWAIAADDGKRLHRRAIFKLAEPSTPGTGEMITIRLKHEYGGKHTLGRFRVSFGRDLHAGQLAEEQGREARDRKFADWVEREAEKLVDWKKMRPTQASSEVPTLTIEADDGIFASGDFTKNDTYKLKFASIPTGVRAFRIQVLPDDRLPRRGPGTVSYEGPEGDFYLSNIKVRQGEQEVKMKSAMNSFANGGNSAEKAIDDDLQSGWSVDGGQGREHNAVFVFEKPLDGGELELDLTCERYYAAGIGRFRIFLTTAEKVSASSLTDEVYRTLLRYQGKTSEVIHEDYAAADRSILMKHFAQIAPELAAARSEIEQLRGELPKFPTTLVMRERPEGHSRKTMRHHRGEFLQPREEVKPGLPTFLGPADQKIKTRLDFARWLVSPENPLTSRVTVNRQWETLFGRGLVRTTEDFGFQGELPSHPELLDWLALEFIKQGWSMKKLNKLLVMSATYQQSSTVTPELLERDPQNILLTRGARFRVESEIVRDAALSMSGLLVDKLGGPSVFPPQPAGVSTEGAYGQLQWKVSEGKDRYRRGLYTFAKRTAPYAMTLTFDGPSGEACLARRDRSNTPLQALTLLNDEVFMECAKALGDWAARQTGSEEAIVEQIFQRCLARPPRPGEKMNVARFFRTQMERLKSGEIKASDLTGKAEARIEEAAWTAVARVLLNLDETITKS